MTAAAAIAPGAALTTAGRCVARAAGGGVRNRRGRAALNAGAIAILKRITKHERENCGNARSGYTHV